MNPSITIVFKDDKLNDHLMLIEIETHKDFKNEIMAKIEEFCEENNININLIEE